jgi:hypothetical protein
MPSALIRLLVLAATSAAGALLLWWPRLSSHWRQRTAIGASAVGIGFLLVAVSSEGFRESSTVAVFLLVTPYVTEQATASASLPYYVLTAACLALGLVGLAAGDEVAATLRRRWLAAAIALSLAVTALRFALEKVAAPWALTHTVGITWLAPIVGAWIAFNVRAEGRGFRAVLGSLALYAVAVRGAVAALMLIASLLNLGSHYDVSALVKVTDPFTGGVHEFERGSLTQILVLGVVPQLVFWPIYTIVAGLVGAGVFWIVERIRGRGARPAPAVRAPMAMAAAREDGPAA